MNRFLSAASGALFFLLQLASVAANAEDFPSRPIRIVHPYPGGSIDAVTRVMAERLKEMWGQPVIIDSKPGASEILAVQELTKSKPDGYTWFIGTESGFFNNSFLFRKLPYDPVTQLQPVSELFAVNFALNVRGDLPVRNLAEFIALAKKEPGKLRYGSFGNGSGPHLAMTNFESGAGVPPMLNVPYKAPTQALQDLLGGQIDALIGPTALSAPFLADAKLRVLAITGSARQKNMPDVPTFAESGYASVNYRSMFGLAVPQGTPAEVVKKIHAAVVKVLSMPDMADKYLTPNSYQLIGSDPQAFSQSLAAHRARAQRVFTELKIEPQ